MEGNSNTTITINSNGTLTISSYGTGASFDKDSFTYGVFPKRLGILLVGGGGGAGGAEEKIHPCGRLQHHFRLGGAGGPGPGGSGRRPAEAVRHSLQLRRVYQNPDGGGV